LIKAIEIIALVILSLTFACSSTVQTLTSKEVEMPASEMKPGDGRELNSEWIEGLGEYPPDRPPVAQIVSYDAISGMIVAEGVPHFVSWDISQPRTRLCGQLRYMVS
jgi:hypothetical protein